VLRYICSLPNPGTEGKVHEVFYPDDDVGRTRAEKFAQLENKPGRGVYDCIGILQDGARSRCIETIAELERLPVDLDLKNIAEPRDDVLQCLHGLLLPPSEIRDSGYGLHAIWYLKEPVTDAAGLAQAETIMKQLVELLAGDPAPTHRAALLRRPGTDNTKNGDARRCCVIEASGQQYDVTEFEAMFDLYGDQPKLTRNQESPKSASTDEERKEPIDIDARLAAMRYRGTGDSAINVTRTAVCSSMLARGIGVEEIVRIVMDATRRCVANDPECAKWRWSPNDPGKEKSEEQLIWRSCVDFIAKHPERLGDRLPDKLQQQLKEILVDGKKPYLSRNVFGWYLKRGREDSKPAEGAPADSPLSKRDIIRKMLLEGTTHRAVLKAVGWQTISLPQQARMLGLKLTKYEEGGETKYKAVPDSERPDASGDAERPKRTKPELFVLRAFVPFDPATLPPRQWLYGRHYLRQTVSATVAPGGYGKSTLDMVEGLPWLRAATYSVSNPTSVCASGFIMARSRLRKCTAAWQRSASTTASHNRSLSVGSS
jgi:hypothetical protein